MQDEQKDEELQEDVEKIEEVPEAPAETETVEEAPAEEPAEAQQPEIPKKLEQEVKQVGAPVPGRMERLRAFIMECKRVLRVTKKPDRAEFTTIVKISSIGMGIIGIVGFVVHFLQQILFK